MPAEPLRPTLLPGRTATLALAASLAALSAFVGGCDGRLNPLASFNSGCAALPAARFSVVTTPLTFTEDDSQGVAELSTRSGAAPGRERTYGLTVANFGHETESRLHVLEERATGRACGTPEVDVTLSMRPTTVYVARELAATRCQHDATREHELLHVAEYRALLAEAAAQLAADLPNTIGEHVQTAATAAELRQHFDAALGTYMREFMRSQHAVLAARQADIDSPAEYARVAQVCAGR